MRRWNDRPAAVAAPSTAIGTAVVLVLAGMNGPWLYGFAREKYHEYKINQPEYKADERPLGDRRRPRRSTGINTIHAALLHTGKVLLVAGSGNNAEELRREEVRHACCGTR